MYQPPLYLTLQEHNFLVARHAARVVARCEAEGLPPPFMLALDSSTCQTGFALLCAGVPTAAILLVTNSAADADSIRKHPRLGGCVRKESVTVTFAGLGPQSLGVAYLDYCGTLHGPLANDILPLLRRGLLVPGGALAVT